MKPGILGSMLVALVSMEGPLRIEINGLFTWHSWIDGKGDVSVEKRSVGIPRVITEHWDMVL